MSVKGKTNHTPTMPPASVSSRVMVDLEGVYVNGAPQGITLWIYPRKDLLSGKITLSSWLRGYPPTKK